jgi:hypothetical protein
VHHGTAVVTSPDGAVDLAVGDPEGVVFPRSSSKPFQALAMVRHGLATSGRLLSLACSSHSGEEFHLEGVREILAGAGLTETDLQNTPGYRPGDYGMAITSIHEARFVLFDDDTRLAFITSFDGPWDAYMEDFFTSGPTLGLFDVIFRHVEGYDGLPDLAAVRAFVLGAEVSAAAYARNYGGTVKEIRKAQRVNHAFQQVLDHPQAAEALQHPALQPLLDEAAD